MSWDRASCSKQQPFLCKRPAMNYKFEFSSNQTTFVEAKAQCQKAKGALVSLDSVQKENIVTELIPSGYTYWIGLTSKNEGANRW